MGFLRNNVHFLKNFLALEKRSAPTPKILASGGALCAPPHANNSNGCALRALTSHERFFWILLFGEMQFVSVETASLAVSEPLVVATAFVSKMHA